MTPAWTVQVRMRRSPKLMETEELELHPPVVKVMILLEEKVQHSPLSPLPRTLNPTSPSSHFTTIFYYYCLFWVPSPFPAIPHFSSVYLLYCIRQFLLFPGASFRCVSAGPGANSRLSRFPNFLRTGRALWGVGQKWLHNCHRSNSLRSPGFLIVQQWTILTFSHFQTSSIFSLKFFTPNLIYQTGSFLFSLPLSHLNFSHSGKS